MMKCVLLFALLALAGLVACNCDGTPNMLPISVDAPVLVNTTANGKYFIQNSVTPGVAVVHVYGTPYEMGFAQGALMKQQINEFFPQVYQYLYEQIGSYIGFLPQWMQNIVETDGVAFLLDLTWDLTKDYTPQHFIDEMQGLADGAGIPVKQVIQVHMIPEVIKAHCSMVGAWGSAISNTTGSLYQLRALDWSTNGPFQMYPQVTVYHPQDGNGHPFSIVTWTGFIGAMTGYSSASVGICEKVWLSYNGTSTRSGMPWDFVLRDILQFDKNIDSALNRIYNVQRTCSIFVGLGDNSINQFRAVEYSEQYVRVGDDVNFPEWTGHPSMESVVYIDKHYQPSSDPCLGDLLEKYYGNLDCETILQLITPVHQTGDMHIAVYDYAQNYMFVANASPVPPSGDASKVIPAYDRPFIRFDMGNLFSEQEQ